MVSLEAYIEDEHNCIHEIADASYDFEEKVMASDFCQRLKEQLSMRYMCCFCSICFPAFLPSGIELDQSESALLTMTT